MGECMFTIYCLMQYRLFNYLRRIYGDTEEQTVTCKFVC